jgi:hypothetical protein
MAARVAGFKPATDIRAFGGNDDEIRNTQSHGCIAGTDWDAVDLPGENVELAVVFNSHRSLKAGCRAGDGRDLVIRPPRGDAL